MPASSSPHDDTSCFTCALVKKNHPATVKATKQETYIFKNEKEKQEFAAKVIREKLVSEASTSSGRRYGTVTLATGGTPIKVEVKSQNTNAMRLIRMIASV